MLKISEKLNVLSCLEQERHPERPISTYGDQRFLPIRRKECSDYLQYATSVLVPCARLLNRMEHRPLDGFVSAVAPLTFVPRSESLRCARDSGKHGSFQTL